MKVLGMFGRTGAEALADADAPLDDSAPPPEEFGSHDDQTSGDEASSEFHEVLEQLREEWGRLGFELRQQQDQCITGLIELCERLERRQRQQMDALETLEREAVELREERERLAAEAAQFRDEREQLKAEAARLQEGQDRLVDEAAQLRDERDQLAGDAAQSHSGQEKFDSEIAQLRKERNEFAAEAARLRKERAQLASEIAQLADERDLFAAELTERDGTTSPSPEIGAAPAKPATRERAPARASHNDLDDTATRQLPSSAPDGPASSRDKHAKVDATSGQDAVMADIREPAEMPDCIETVRATVIRDNDQMQSGIKARLHEVSCSAVSLLLPRPLKVEEYVVIEMENERERTEVRVRAYVRHIQPVVDGWHLISFATVNQLEFKDVQGLKVS